MHHSASQTIGIIELTPEAAFDRQPADSDPSQCTEESSRLPSQIFHSQPGCVTIVADTDQLNRDLLEELELVRQRVDELRSEKCGR